MRHLAYISLLEDFFSAAFYYLGAANLCLDTNILTKVYYYLIYRVNIYYLHFINFLYYTEVFNICVIEVFYDIFSTRT